MTRNEIVFLVLAIFGVIGIWKAVSLLSEINYRLFSGLDPKPSERKAQEK